MAKVEFTKLSTKGQVVIPKRLRAGLEEGTPFAITRRGDTIILRRLDVLREFERILEEGKRIVKKTGLKQSDVPKIIERIRRSKR